jgi:hypothetical protein
MNVEIVTEVAQFPEKENINVIFVAVCRWLSSSTRLSIQIFQSCDTVLCSCRSLVANARSLSLESRLVAPADGTLNFAGVYAGGSLQQVLHTDIAHLCSRIKLGL